MACKGRWQLQNFSTIGFTGWSPCWKLAEGMTLQLCLEATHGQLLLGESVLGVVQGKLMAVLGAVGISLSWPLGRPYRRNVRGAGEDIAVNTIHPLPCGSHPSTNVLCLSVALFLLPEGSTGLGGFHPSSSLPDCGRGILPLGAR